nr:hypothetical protein [Hyphomicrobium zavarzinii]
MAEKDVKPESTAEEAASGSLEKKVRDLKDGSMSILRILMLNVALMVTNFAALSNFNANTTIYGHSASHMLQPVVWGGFALLCWLGLTWLSVVRRDRVLSKIMSLLFGISFISALAMIISGIRGGTVDDMLASLFGIGNLPYFSVYSFFTAAGLTESSILFVVTLIYAVVITANVWNLIRLGELGGKPEPNGKKCGF